MHFAQNLSNHPDYKPQKSKSKNKMVKSRNTNSQKSSLKTISHLSKNITSQISHQPKTPNFLIKEKYFRPAIKQYERSDANMITRCVKGDFDDFEDKTMELYEFVKFYTIKETLRKYEEGILNNFRDKFLIISPINYYNASVSRHIFHFYDKSYQILKNRVMKLKSLQIHHSLLKSQKGSSIKNSDRKKGSKSKSKQKAKNMQNLLKGIFKTNSTKPSQKSAMKSKIKKISKLPESRQTHIISKDTQDMNHLLNELSKLLKTHNIQSYSEISTQEQIPSPYHEFSTNISAISGSATTPQKSRVKEIARQNQFTEIMQSQYSHISAIKSSQIVTSPDQFEFYGLSSLKDKKIKRQQKNSTKNQSYFANADHSTNESRLTNKRVSTNLLISNIFSQQTPKKFVPLKINDPKSKDEETKKSNSNSKTLRKGLQEKSKSKSLSSTQKSLKKDPSAPLTFKNTKILSNAKSTKNMSERLLFMQPLNEKDLRKPAFLSSARGQDRKNSKSKSKGKMMLQKK